MILQSGITPDTDKLLDLARAIQSGKVNYAVAGGTANALTATLSPAPASLTVGMEISVRIATSNTGPATLNINGTGAEPIVRGNNQPLVGGELSGIARFIWDGTSFQMASLGPGQLLNLQRFTASGTYTPTPGTNLAFVRAIGGGGAGGGGFSTSASSYAVGSGGAAGSYGEKFVLSPNTTAVTIGLGGVGASGASGGSGGTTSFGALLSCPGGGGGPTATIASNSSIVSAQGAPGAVPTGADKGWAGQPGQCGFIFANFGPVSGQGAMSQFGAGGTNTAGGIGGAGSGHGSGSGGNANGVSQGNTTGSTARSGYLEVWEYS